MSGSGISSAICKSAPRSKQITIPAPTTLSFTGRMPFLPPNQQRQSTKGIGYSDAKFRSRLASMSHKWHFCRHDSQSILATQKHQTLQQSSATTYTLTQGGCCRRRLKQTSVSALRQYSWFKCSPRSGILHWFMPAMSGFLYCNDTHLLVLLRDINYAGQRQAR